MGFHGQFSIQYIHYLQIFIIPILNQATRPSGVKYCRALVDGASTGAVLFGFGRCVSTALIGNAYLKEKLIRLRLSANEKHEPLFITSIRFWRKLYDCMQRDFDIRQILLWQMVEICVSA